MEKYITVPNAIKRELRTAFNCTKESVWKALNYKSNSELAKKIRKRALDRGGVIYQEKPEKINYNK